MEFKTYFAVEWLCYPHSRPVNLTVMKWGEGWWKMYRNQCNPDILPALIFNSMHHAAALFWSSAPAVRSANQLVNCTVQKHNNALLSAEVSTSVQGVPVSGAQETKCVWLSYTTVHTSVKHRRGFIPRQGTSMPSATLHPHKRTLHLLYSAQ